MIRLTPDSLRKSAERFRTRFEPGRVCGLLVAGTGLTLTVPGWELREEVPLAEILPLPIPELEAYQASQAGT